MNKENKHELVAEMHDKLLRANAVFLADFRGMNVGQATALRNELRKANVEYKVVKNTLLEIASKGTDKEGLNPFYAGPTAIALCYDDPVAAAKVLSRFSKAFAPSRRSRDAASALERPVGLDFKRSRAALAVSLQ